MNPEDEKYSKSPHKSSVPAITTCSTSDSETVPSLSLPLMGSQQFSYGSLFMEDVIFSTSPLSSSFISPSMEFEAFSASSPLTYPSSEFKENPVSEVASTGPLATRRGIGDEVEDIGMPQPLESLQGNPIPPFLWKTFDLVDDRMLDPIISWGPTGESFVVWDPVEFSRLVLPRNFKHNNFSSFVRQLNTYGFRKIHTDRWEFANEAFRRGERHLLKNIQRRKLPQSQQTGNYTGPFIESEKSGLESEVDRLRKERSMMMEEVVELQQQQRGTVHHMKEVNQRIQAAEQRQKQMVSFLAKLFQNPSFLARLRQRKDHGLIGSSRMKRKFIKPQGHEPGQSEPSMEGQIVKYRPEGRNLASSSVVPDINPTPIEKAPDYVLQGMVEMSQGGGFQIENIPSDKWAISDELAAAEGYIKTLEQVEKGASSLESEDAHFKGKNVMSPQQEVAPEHFVSYPEGFAAEKNFLEFSPSCIESIVKQEDVIWSMGFDTRASLSSASNGLWGDFVNYDVPELGLTRGFSDVWDLGFVQIAGGSDTKWPAEENPLDEPESHSGQPKDDKSKNMDP